MAFKRVKANKGASGISRSFLLCDLILHDYYNNIAEILFFCNKSANITKK